MDTQVVESAINSLDLGAENLSSHSEEHIQTVRELAVMFANSSHQVDLDHPNLGLDKRKMTTLWNFAKLHLLDKGAQDPNGSMDSEYKVAFEDSVSKVLTDALQVVESAKDTCSESPITHIDKGDEFRM